MIANAMLPNVTWKIFGVSTPHLKVIVREDALASNAPHIHELEKHTLHYILGVKPKDHEYLYQCVDEAVEAGHSNELHLSDPDKADVHHCFRSQPHPRECL